MAYRVVTGNRILDALPPEEFDHIYRHCEPTSLTAKESLYRAGDRIEFLYFPVMGMISVTSPLSDGTSIEVGTIGNEGVVGLPALLGNSISPHDVTVQGAGAALRASTNALRSDFDRYPRFHELALRFTELFIELISQTAACNARHSLEERSARWLSTMCDRMGSDHFPLTHEFLAMLLGVQRTGVTAAAVQLNRRGLIHYTHGHIAVLDRAGLEATACECYRQMKNRIEEFPGEDAVLTRRELYQTRVV